MRGGRTIAGFGLIPVLLLGAACSHHGGGGGSPTSTDPTIPVIANLRVALGQPCTLEGTGGIRGTGKSVAVDYTDADGNVRGGVATLRVAGSIGDPATFTVAIPSAAASLSGTTSGTITITSCLHFGSNSTLTQAIQITDASGKASNILSAQVSNPGGLPLLPSGNAPREGFQLGQ